MTQYFVGTKQECENLVSRLNEFYKYPNEHIYTFDYPQKYNDDYLVVIKDRHYNDLTDEEKLKVKNIEIELTI